MHEAKLAAGILDTVRRVASENGGSRITAIKLQIGEFTCVQPDTLRFCLETLAEGTIASGAGVSIIRTKTEARCAQCNNQFEVCDIRFCCPLCASTQIELLSGRELLIESIEVE